MEIDDFFFTTKRVRYFVFGRLQQKKVIRVNIMDVIYIYFINVIL